MADVGLSCTSGYMSDGAGARLAAQAQRGWRKGVSGYYVRRKATKIIVRGPFASWTNAQRELASAFRDEPDHMEVVEL